ncbi:hypothetical protein ACS0TY_005784 [Phlomoides rotata]
MSDYGFHVSSLGLLKQDRAYVLALYRGDQTPDQCRACVEATSHKILQVCPNKQEGAKLFNFRDDTLTLLLELRIKASSGSSDIKIGVGTRNISGEGGSQQSRNMSQIYGLTQCIPDLSLENCSICLRNLDPVIDDDVLEFSTGARMLTPYCNIRYELYPFHNETRLRELHLLQPLPPSLLPSSTIGTF